MLSYHDNSLRKALCDLFPDIGLEKDNFKTHRGISLLIKVFFLVIYFLSLKDIGHL